MRPQKPEFFKNKENMKNDRHDEQKTLRKYLIDQGPEISSLD